MRKTLFYYLALLFIVPALLLSVSCQKKVVKANAEPVTYEAKAVEEVVPAEEVDADTAIMQKDIYFDFDRSILTDQAQRDLVDKANVMLANPRMTVIIEGNCDERGTNEYNMALGERRAEAAKTFLIDLGIAPSRLDTVTYGEEKPVDPRSNEEAWSKNRRDHFVVY